MEEIVNWKRRFQALVLERGNRYYKENRVQNFRYEDEEYRARIIGSASYNVEIKIKNDDLVFARCSCPHAAKENYCKHMAALMYAIDDKGEEAKRQALERNATKIQPFQISEDAYQYFDLGRILKDKVVWEKQYEDAKKLVESGDIVLENLEVGYHRFVDGVILCAKAEGYVKERNYNRRMSAIFDREHLIQASCGALGCYGAYSTFYQASSALCVHLLAFFFLIDAYLKKYNPGDSTDLGGRMILNNFRSQYAKNVIADQMDQEQIFHGIKVKGSIPDFVMGDGYRYYFKKDAFCRINNETLHEIQPLMEVSEGGKISFSVGRRNLSEFYHQMLPVLKRNLTVEETEKEEIAEYIPPEAEFLFYLDAEEGRILCRPRARYGEEEVSLMEHCKEDCVFQTFRNTSREEEILQSYKYKKKYYRLRQGGFVAVDEEDMEMMSQMMETLQVSPKEFVKGNMQIPVYRALYLNKMLEQGENVYLNRDSHFKKLIKEFKTIEDSDYEVPESLADVMRNYQKDGFKWMKTLEQYHFGGILADDMGLGKTLQMISVLLAAKQSGESGTSLIVAPASLVFNWGEEFARFAPELKVQLIVGTQKERAELIRDYQNTDVFVTSYDLLKRDITEYEDIKFSYQVLDEAQYIKNHSTAAAKSVKIIKSSYRYALTGTPIENRLSELWSIFDYLMPGFLYSYDRFRKEIETPIVKHKEEKVSGKFCKTGCLHGTD